jgi:hypothetical protein
MISRGESSITGLSPWETKQEVSKIPHEGRYLTP